MNNFTVYDKDSKEVKTNEPLTSFKGETYYFDSCSSPTKILVVDDRYDYHEFYPNVFGCSIVTS